MNIFNIQNWINIFINPLISINFFKPLFINYPFKTPLLKSRLKPTLLYKLLWQLMIDSPRFWCRSSFPYLIHIILIDFKRCMCTSIGTVIFELECKISPRFGRRLRRIVLLGSVHGLWACLFTINQWWCLISVIINCYVCCWFRNEWGIWSVEWLSF